MTNTPSVAREQSGQEEESNLLGMETLTPQGRATSQGQAYRIVYGPGRFPVQPKREDGTWGCRGCAGVIPKGRQTWCSKECSERYNPNEVLFAAKQRDRRVCQECGFDHAEAEREWWKAKPDWAVVGWQGHQKWERQKPIEEYDHIIPFSEGGLTVVENIRTLCRECHAKRTARWHKDRRIRKKSVASPSDVRTPNARGVEPLGNPSESAPNNSARRAE